MIKLQRACDAFKRSDDGCSKAEDAFGAASQRSPTATVCCFPASTVVRAPGSGLAARLSQFLGV